MDTAKDCGSVRLTIPAVSRCSVGAPASSPRAVEQADEKGRRWRLIDISPAQWMMTELEKRTVNITTVQVWVNDELQLEITDPSGLLDVEGKIPIWCGETTY